MICTPTTEPSESLAGWIPACGQSPEEAYHLLLNANPLPMWVYDLDTLGFLEVNDAAVQHYGYSREEFLSMSITDLRPLEEVPRLLEFSLLLQQAVPSRPGSYAAGIWRHRKKDGTPLDVEIIGTPVPYARRRAVVILAMDVTERLRSQAQAIEHTRMATLIAETGAALGSAVTLKEGLQQCAEILARTLPAPFVRVWTLNQADGMLELQASAGAPLRWMPTRNGSPWASAASAASRRRRNPTTTIRFSKSACPQRMEFATARGPEAKVFTRSPVVHSWSRAAWSELPRCTLISRCPMPRCRPSNRWRAGSRSL
jgi:PAS domain S-box-containing protein